MQVSTFSQSTRVHSFSPRPADQTLDAPPAMRNCRNGCPTLLAWRLFLRSLQDADQPRPDLTASDCPCRRISPRGQSPRRQMPEACTRACVQVERPTAHSLFRRVVRPNDQACGSINTSEQSHTAWSGEFRLVSQVYRTSFGLAASLQHQAATWRLQLGSITMSRVRNSMATASVYFGSVADIDSSEGVTRPGTAAASLPTAGRNPRSPGRLDARLQASSSC